MKNALVKAVKEHECEGIQKEATFLSNLSALDDVLKDVYETRRPTSTEYDKRRDLIRVFNEIAQELYGKDDNYPVVEEFGSFLMDMFNASSDLDLSINFSHETGKDRRSVQTQTLRKFAKKLYKLQDQGHVTNVKPILSARVPVLKVTDCGSGVECDLSVGNLDGIAKSQIVHSVSSIDERFQKLSFLMKDWAKAQEINSAVDGTLNSLSLILLAAFHLQTRDTPILPPFSAILKGGTDLVNVQKRIISFMNYGKKNKESLAELFVSLLIKLELVESFWSKGLCASTFKGSWINRKWTQKEGPMRGSISIEDFTDRSQNASRALKTLPAHMKIYTCIHFSLNQIRLFTQGKINAEKLKRSLFGVDPSATHMVTSSINQLTVCANKKKRKQPTKKKTKQPSKGTPRKGKKVTSISGRTAKARKILSGPLATQTVQGGQIEPSSLSVLTHLAAPKILTPSSSVQGYGDFTLETSHVAPGLMSSQPHRVSNSPFQDSRRFGQEGTHAEIRSHTGPYPLTQGLGMPSHTRREISHVAPIVMSSQPHRVSNLPFQDSRRFGQEGTRAENWSHTGPYTPTQGIGMSNHSRRETSHVASSVMASQPHRAPDLPIQDSRRFGQERTYAEDRSQTSLYLPTQSPGRYSRERTHVPDLSFQGNVGFRPQRSHDEGFSHAPTNISASHLPPFSDLPNQRYGGYRIEGTHVETFRHDNTWASRSSSTSTMHPHHPYAPYTDHARWERSYAPRPSFPLGASQYPNDTRECGNRYRF